MGSLIYIPRGNLHTHKNVGEGPGRMLVSQTPGGSHERFFEEIGEPATVESRQAFPESSPDIVSIAAKYGIEIPSSLGKLAVRDAQEDEGCR